MKAVGLKKAEAQKQNWQMKEDSLKIDKKKRRYSRNKLRNNQIKQLTQTFFFFLQNPRRWCKDVKLYLTIE